MQRKLTDPFIRKLKPGPKRIEVRDTLLPGFGIRVSPKGKKTHFVCCRVYGKQKRVQLGHYPAVTLADARKRAREILECPEALIDEKPAMTVDQALDLYFKLYVATHIKHPRDQESRLKRKFGSQFGHRDLESIKKPEIVAILDTIMAEEHQRRPIASSIICIVFRLVCGARIYRNKPSPRHQKTSERNSSRSVSGPW